MRMRRMRLIEALLIIEVLIFGSACTCSPTLCTPPGLATKPDDEAPPNPHKTVTCKEVLATVAAAVASGNWAINGGAFTEQQMAQAVDCFNMVGPQQTTGQGQLRPRASTTPAPPRANTIASAPSSSAPSATNSQTGTGPTPQVLPLPFLPMNPSNVTSPACTPSASPDVLVVNQGNGSLTRLTTCPLAVTALISLLGSNPMEVAVTPDGSTALVTMYSGSIEFINLATNTVSFTMNLPANVSPSGIAITPDGTQAYVTNYVAGAGSVLVINIATRSIVATLPMPAWPQNAFITPDGAQLYITFPIGTAMSVIDTLTNTVATTVNIAATYGIAFNPTGTTAYVATQSPNGYVFAVSTSTFKTLTQYQVGVGPNDVLMPFGGRYVYVTNYTSQQLSVIDTLTGSVTNTNLDGAPLGLTLIQ